MYRCMSCVIQYLGDSHHLAILLTCKKPHQAGLLKAKSAVLPDKAQGFWPEAVETWGKDGGNSSNPWKSFFLDFHVEWCSKRGTVIGQLFYPNVSNIFSGMIQHVGKDQERKSVLLLPELSSWKGFVFFSRPGGFLTWFSKAKTLQAWSLVTGHLGNDLWSSLLELLLKNEKEMLQDRNLQKLLDFLGWCCHQFLRCPKQKPWIFHATAF